MVLGTPERVSTGDSTAASKTWRCSRGGPRVPVPLTGGSTPGKWIGMKVIIAEWSGAPELISISSGVRLVRQPVSCPIDGMPSAGVNHPGYGEGRRVFQFFDGSRNTRLPCRGPENTSVAGNRGNKCKGKQKKEHALAGEFLGPLTHPWIKVSS